MKKLFVLLFALPMLTACGISTVDTGHRGLKVRFGEVVEGPLTEGLYFYNPVTTNMIEMDTRTQKWDGQTEGYTKDVQDGKFSFTLNYRLDNTKVAEIYSTVGLDYANVIIPQIVLGSMKEVIGQWNAVDVISNRDKVTRSIQNSITGALAERGIVVEKYEITDVEFSGAFEKSVEAKVVAQQKAIEEQNRTVQIQEQANQKVLQAKAEAESIRIRAQALEQNAKLVEWEAVQKWDGKLPVMMFGEGTIPMIQLPAGKK